MTEGAALTLSGSGAFGVRRAAGALGASRATEVCLGLTLSLLWATAHGFTGIEGDARIYMGRVLADIDPAGVGRDLMFALDGQSSFSLFRILARGIAETAGLGATVATLSIVSLVVWFAAAALLARTVAPARAIVLVLATVCVLPRLYTPWNLLAAGEAMPVPRPLAEAGVLIALAALCRGRAWSCVAALVVAAAFHPIMAAPGFGVLLVVLGRTDRRWFLGAAGCAAAFLGAGLLGVPLAARLVEVADPAWRDLLQIRNPYLFLRLWPPAVLGTCVVQAVTLLIAARDLAPRARFVFQASLAVAAAGCAASWLLADMLSDVLALQAQLWRALWLPAALAPITAGLCLWHLPRRGPRGHIALALLCVAWTSEMMPLAPLAAGAAVAALVWVPRLRAAPSPAVVRAVWAACLLPVAAAQWSSLVVLVDVVSKLPHDSGVGPLTDAAIAWRMIWSVKLPLVPVVVLAVAACRWPESIATQVGAAFAAIVTLVLVATLWDGRTAAHADIDAATLKPDLQAMLAPRPGPVLWLDGDEVWYWARRANWNGPTQGGGSVFSREQAELWNRRASAMLTAGLATRHFFEVWTQPDSLTALPLDATKVHALCGRSDAPAWIVAPLEPGESPPPGLAAATWSPPLPIVRLYVAGQRTRWRRLDRYAVVACGADPAKL